MSLISIDDLDFNTIKYLLELADYYQYPYNKKNYENVLTGKTLVNIFFENSTRTSLSFQKAILNLGGNYLQYDISKSSINKGETISDTIKTVENYADIITIRHPDNNIFHKFNCNKLLINAGNGTDEHPTQSLSDLLTIYKCNNKNINSIDNLIIGIVGDLKYGRTVNSLIKLLVKFNNITFYLISPEQLKVSEQVKSLIIKNNCHYKEDTDIKKYLHNIDVLYMTRLQKERIKNNINLDYYNLSLNDLKNVKKNFIIMHPFPRNNEINVDIDNTKYAKYFLQSKLAVYMRMSIITYLYFKNNNINNKL